MRGEGRVFQRGRRWWIAYWGFRPNGDTGEVRESAGETEEAARGLLRRRLREVENHREGIRKFRGPNQERVTVGELLDDLKADYETRGIKSLRHSLGHMKPVREHFGFARAITVTADAVNRYVLARQKENLSNATINRETEVLGRGFKLGLENGKVSFAPRIRALPENNVRHGFFEKAEFDTVLPHLPSPIDEIARFGYLSGWRRSEISGLRWENVDRAAGEIRLFTSKNGEGRVLPMDEALSALIARRWEAREYETSGGGSALSAYVFHVKGRPVGNFFRAWRRACETARIPGRLFHDLRRTAVRDMIRGGVSQHVAMAISGHKTPSMFQRYNITSAEDKLEALRRRQSYIEGRGNGAVVPLRVANSDKDSDR